MLSFLQRPKTLIWFLILAGFFVYANALPNQLFWDDHDGIVNNTYVHDWSNFEQFFSQNLIAGAGLNSNYWRPLLLISYALEWSFFGNWPPAYHFTNVVLHLVAAILLFFLLWRLLEKRGVAFFTALIFLIHPLQTEAVTYVSGRADPLSALLIFAGLLCYLKYYRQSAPVTASSQPRLPSSRPRRWPVLLFFVLSLLTKEKNVLIFPALLLLVDLFLWFKTRPSGARPGKIKSASTISTIQAISQLLRRELKALWPVALIAAGYALLRATVLNFQNTFNLYDEANPYTESLIVRAATFFKILPRYLELIFFPHDLHMERTVSFQTSFFNFWTLLGLTLTLALIAALIIALKQKKPAIAFALLWFLITLFPASGLLMPVAGLMYEHYLYLPLVGIFLALALLVENRIPKNFPTSKPASIAALLVLALYLGFLGVQTIRQNAIWRNPITFYDHVIQYNPNSLRIWNNLGMAYAEAQEIDPAITAYQHAIELDPGQTSAPPRHNLGNLYYQKGELDRAIPYFEQAIQIDEQFLFSYFFLARLYLEQGKQDQAVELLQRAQAVFPDNAEIQRALEQITSPPLPTARPAQK